MTGAESVNDPSTSGGASYPPAEVADAPRRRSWGIGLADVALALVVVGLLGNVAFARWSAHQRRAEVRVFGGALVDAAALWERRATPGTVGASRPMAPMPSVPDGWTVASDRHGVMVAAGGQLYLLRTFAAFSENRDADCVVRVVVRSAPLPDVPEGDGALDVGSGWQERWVECHVGRATVVQNGTPVALRRFRNVIMVELD